jgi:hypothetical protein
MQIIQYLNNTFYTKTEFLAVAKITEQELNLFQQQKIMPSPSYVLKLDYAVTSVFGEEKNQMEVHYYAKPYAEWIKLLQKNNDPEVIFNIFLERYKNTIAELKDQYYVSNDPKLHDQIEGHIKEEWGHFLDGTYGLCTVSGLPEDIAAKEFAILSITEFSQKDILSAKERTQLSHLITLLDKASSLFAPHERLRSSRHKHITEICKKYNLNPDSFSM